MANIKFSQFTVGNTESDIDFVVGYKGGDNIQISPTNLLAASLSGYLPLVGGTMTGTSGIHMPDNFALKAGNSQDLEIFHNGTDSSIRNFEGNLIIRNADADKDISFQADNSSGGVAEYFRLDGSVGSGSSVFTVFPDNSRATFGTGFDLQIYHDATNSYLKQQGGGDLIIQQETDNKDIIFKSDDGSGGLATYLRLDGSDTLMQASVNLRFSDNVKSTFGNSDDLQVYHDGINSVINNTNGNLQIYNNANDKDIVFISDNGSGGNTEYFRVDGSSEINIFSKSVRLNDSVELQVGSGQDLKIYHNGSNTYIENYTSDLIISNTADDADIRFFCDNGSGGLTEYFKLDGSSVTTQFYKTIKLYDTAFLYIGDGNDLQFYHNGANSTIANYTGNLYIANNTNDGDISFQSDDGSGGVIEYFRVDGGTERIESSKSFRFADGARIQLGSGSDMQIHHTGGSNFIEVSSGGLTIRQNTDDGDISFQSDDGSGGVTEYFRVDGGENRIVYSVDGRHLDNVKSMYGSGADLQIYHDGGNSLITNTTGELLIRDDSIIRLQKSNGENMLRAIADGAVELYHNNEKKLETTGDGVNVIGGTTTGSTHRLSVGKTASGVGNHKSILELSENTQATDMNYGFSFTADGDASNNLLIKRHSNNIAGVTVMTVDRNNDDVTFAGNLKVQGVSEYADNTAAIAGGLTTGQLYRTGDLLKIVH